MTESDPQANDEAFLARLKVAGVRAREIGEALSELAETKALIRALVQKLRDEGRL